MRLPDKDDLVDLDIRDLLHLRYFELRSKSSALKSAVDTHLYRRVNEFKLDDLAFLIDVLPRKCDENTIDLYNAVLDALVEEDTPYRYRYIVFNIMRRNMRQREIWAWIHGKETLIDANALEKDIAYMVAYSGTEQFRELALGLAQTSSTLIGRCAPRLYELDREMRDRVMQHVAKYIELAVKLHGKQGIKQHQGNQVWLRLLTMVDVASIRSSTDQITILHALAKLPHRAISNDQLKDLCKPLVLINPKAVRTILEAVAHNAAIKMQESA